MVVKYLIIETVKIIVNARAAFFSKGSSPLEDKLPHLPIIRILQRYLSFELESFLKKVRSQVMLVKLLLNTLFEFADKFSIIGIERVMLLKPKFLYKNIMTMHIHSKKQADKAYINSDSKIRNKEKNRIFGIKFCHAQKTMKLQKDYGVEYAKNQLLMMILDLIFTSEYQNEIAQLYREKGTLGRFIGFYLDLEHKTRRMLDFIASAHKLQKELRRELEQIEKAAHHCQAAEESYKMQLEKCETLQILIKAKNASIVNLSLGRHPALRQQKASAISSAEFAGLVTSSANEDQEIIE